MQDVAAVITDAAGTIEINGIDLDEASSVMLADVFGEQPLLLRRIDVPTTQKMLSELLAASSCRDSGAVGPSVQSVQR